MASGGWRNRASQKMTYGVKVNNLPPDITREQVHVQFAAHGRIESVVVIKRDVVCHGFVNYSTLLQAQRVADKMNGTRIGGRKVVCRANTEPRLTRCQSQPLIDNKLHNPCTTSSKSQHVLTPVVRQYSTSSVPTVKEPSTIKPPKTHIDPVLKTKQPLNTNQSFGQSVKSTSVAKKPSIASKPPNSSKEFELPFHSIPLFEQDDAIKRLREIEAQHNVEFHVINSNQTMGTTDIKSFAEQVKQCFSRAKHNNDSIPTQEGLTTYFLGRRAGASRNGGCGPQWYYRDDDGIYVEYSSEQSSELEQMFQTKTTHCLWIKGNRYSFNFTAMTQTNVHTYTSRPIQRNQEPSCIKRRLTLQVRGQSSTLEPSIHKLQTAVKETTIEKEFRFYDNSSEDFKMRLITTMNKYFVTIQQMEGGMKLIGVRGYIEMVHLFAEHEKLSEREEQIHAQMTVTRFAVPSNWEPQKEKIVLNAVRQGSKEWNDEEKRVCQTLQGVTIVRLERVQSKWLWERYSFAKKQMDRRNKGHVGEKLLFHGTRSTPPDKIYRSEKGVDFRFSREGLWGNGAYFAVKASYSNSYAYSVPGGFNEKQMFICKVLTGDCYDAGTSADKSLRQPPLKPGKGAEEKRYDSVKGHTNGSDVYVIYDHDKVYPAYLVTYRAGASSTYHLPPPPPWKPAKKDSCIIS